MKTVFKELMNVENKSERDGLRRASESGSAEA